MYITIRPEDQTVNLFNCTANFLLTSIIIYTLVLHGKCLSENIIIGYDIFCITDLILLQKALGT